jgi:hypothetical protein
MREPRHNRIARRGDGCGFEVVSGDVSNKFIPLESEQFVTKHSERRSRKKKLFQKLVLAQSDVHSGFKACELFMEKIGLPEIANRKETAGMSNPLYLPLLDAIIISYSRPFTDNDGLGVLQKKWSQFDNQQFAEAHKYILRYRNELVAQTDQDVRKIQIVPPNVCVVPTSNGSRTIGLGFRVHSYWVAMRQIPVMGQLAAYQATRLWDEVNKLFDELYEGMDLPNKEFYLRIDEGL